METDDASVELKQVGREKRTYRFCSLDCCDTSDAGAKERMTRVSCVSAAVMLPLAITVCPLSYQLC